MLGIEYAINAFDCVKLCKLLHDFGRLDKFNIAYKIDEDFFWEMQYEALYHITDKVKSKFNARTSEQKVYFFDTAMTEYYRLCQAYNVRFRTSDETNPYIKKALIYVCERVDKAPYGIGAELHTKTNHAWSCKLIIYIDNECFTEFMELTEALLEIFYFYKNEVEKLKSEIADQGFVAKKEMKEAA